MFWFVCEVTWVDSWREVWCLLLQLSILQFTLEGQDFNMCPLAKQLQHNFSFSTNCFFSYKGFDKNWSQEPSIWSSEQNQHFISWDSSWLILFALIWFLGRYGWSTNRIFVIELNFSTTSFQIVQVKQNCFSLKLYLNDFYKENLSNG